MHDPSSADPKTPARRTARRGAIGVSVIWLGILAVCYGGAVWYEEEKIRQIPAHRVEVNRLVIPKHRDGHFWVRGTVAGQPVRFMVDTGATHVAISEELAKQAGLSGGSPATSHTANGPMPTRLLRGVTVEAGGLSWPGGVTVGVGLHGSAPDQALLGQGFLSRFDIQIREREMVLTPRVRR